MKNFIVDIDITMSKRVQVCNVENEEQAIAAIRQNFSDNPYDIARNFDAYVGYKIIDVNEE